MRRRRCCGFLLRGFDLRDLDVESTHPLSRRYLDPTFNQQLLTRQSEIDAALRRLVSGIEARERGRNRDSSRRSLREQALPILKLWNLRRKVELGYGLDGEDRQGPSMPEPKADDVLSGALAQARTVVSSWGGTLYFVYLPSWDRYRNGPRAADQERLKVFRVVNALFIPIIDIEPAFQAGRPAVTLPISAVRPLQRARPSDRRRNHTQVPIYAVT